MMNLPQNITKRERIVRGIIGALLLVFALLGLGTVYSRIVGINHDCLCGAELLRYYTYD